MQEGSVGEKWKNCLIPHLLGEDTSRLDTLRQFHDEVLAETQLFRKS